MEDITKIWYYENVSERIGEQVLTSTIEIATEEQIQETRQLNAEGKCPHTIVQDEEGWPYDFRSCAICGKGLGLI